MAGRAVLFDLDDTLHGRREALTAFVLAQHASHGWAERGVAAEDWLRDFHVLEEGGKVWKDVAYTELCRRYDVGVSPERLLEEYVSGFARYAKPRAGMAETLVALRDLGWRLGVVTNGRTGFQTATLEALDLARYVDGIVISEAFGRKKPERAIFEHALSLVGAGGEGSWFVGDDPEADVAGSRAAGMRAIWFEKPGVARPECDGCVGSMGEVLGLVGW